MATEKTIMAAKAIAELYALPNGAAGGYAHVVTDDGNLSDHSIGWCIQFANSGEMKDVYGEEVRLASVKALKLLKQLSVTQRKLAIKMSREI